jgi:hypothetical protein
VGNLRDSDSNISSATRWVKFAVVAILLIIGVPYLLGNCFENVDAGEVVVIQDPFDGELHVYTTPGYQPQWFGKVTRYPRQAQYMFSAPTTKDGSEPNTSKKIRFNDGGHGNLSGSVQWEMPLDAESIIKIHKAFNSAEGVEQRAVVKMIDSAVYLAGPLMSSTESSGERRAELVQFINDQAENGVYVTKAEEVKTKDEAGNERSVLVTKIVMDEKTGQPKRQQGSVLKEFNIRLLPLAISALDYDEVVESQIKERQKATTQVQIAQANARKAQQDAITIEAQGQAAAAKAKWDQETIKAKLVTEAQQKLAVAELAAKEAEQYKRQQILIGEGDAERKRAVMLADGALDPKLQAYKEVNFKYADAIANAKPGAWSPVYQVNGGGTAGSNSAANNASSLVEMLTAKTAKDLSLDLGVSGNTNKK